MRFRARLLFFFFAQCIYYISVYMHLLLSICYLVYLHACITLSIIVKGLVLRDTNFVKAINESFSNVANDLHLDFAPLRVIHTIDEYIISSEAIERLLTAIKKRKCNGPNEIPN